MLSETTDVIVADDNQMLLSVMSEIFKECGYTVRTATDGFSALEQIRKQVPHVLLSDLNMPGMSGFELLSVVRRKFPEIKTIAMSTDYPGEDVVPGIPADAYYAKGTSNVARLFEIVRAIDTGRDVLEPRAETPIWVQGLPIHGWGSSIVFVACPECLRTFPHFLSRAIPFQGEERCPHCFEPVQLAIVR
ncbi:MAG: response regulator [Acidobacteriaceae bacterium]|jgi:CheY-like chemotaxis protein